MSTFPKAKVKRFNEVNGNFAPPVGSYDPVMKHGTPSASSFNKAQRFKNLISTTIQPSLSSATIVRVKSKDSLTEQLFKKPILRDSQTHLENAGTGSTNEDDTNSLRLEIRHLRTELEEKNMEANNANFKVANVLSLVKQHGDNFWVNYTEIESRLNNKVSFINNQVENAFKNLTANWMKNYNKKCDDFKFRLKAETDAKLKQACVLEELEHNLESSNSQNNILQEEIVNLLSKLKFLEENEILLKQEIENNSTLREEMQKCFNSKIQEAIEKYQTLESVRDTELQVFNSAKNELGEKIKFLEENEILLKQEVENNNALREEMQKSFDSKMQEAIEKQQELESVRNMELQVFNSDKNELADKIRVLEENEILLKQEIESNYKLRDEMQKSFDSKIQEAIGKQQELESVRNMELQVFNSAKNEFADKIKILEENEILLKQEIESNSALREELQRSFDSKIQKAIETQKVLESERDMELQMFNSAKNELTDKIKLLEENEILLKQEIESNCALREEMQKRFDCKIQEAIVKQQELESIRDMELQVFNTAKNELVDKIKVLEENEMLLKQEIESNSALREEMQKSFDIKIQEAKEKQQALESVRDMELQMFKSTENELAEKIKIKEEEQANLLTELNLRNEDNIKKSELLKTLQQTLENNTEEINNLNEKLSLCLSQSEIDKNCKQMLEQQLEIQEGETKKLREEISVFVGKNHELATKMEKVITESEEKYSKLENNLLENVNHGLKKDETISTLKEEIEILNQKTEQTEKEIGSNLLKLNIANNVISALKDENKSMEASIKANELVFEEKLKVEIDRREALIISTENTIKELSTEVDNVKQCLEQEKILKIELESSLKHQHALVETAFNERIKNLENNLQASGAEHERANLQLLELKVEMEFKEELLKSCQETISKKDEELAQYQDVIATNHELMTIQESLIQDLDESNQKLCSQKKLIDEKEAKISNLMTVNSSLKIEMEENRQSICISNEKNKSLLQEIEILEDKLKITQHDYSKNMKALRNRLFEKEKELESYKAKVDNEEHQHDKLQRKLAISYESKLKALTEDNSILLKEKIKYKNLYEQLEEKIAPFKEQLDEYEIDRRQWENNSEESNKLLHKMNSQLSTLLGHHNERQKIHYVKKIREDLLELKKENSKLRTEVLKLRKKQSENTCMGKKFDPEKAFQNFKENSAPPLKDSNH